MKQDNESARPISESFDFDENRQYSQKMDFSDLPQDIQSYVHQMLNEYNSNNQSLFYVIKDDISVSLTKGGAITFAVLLREEKGQGDPDAKVLSFIGYPENFQTKKSKFYRVDRLFKKDWARLFYFFATG